MRVFTVSPGWTDTATTEPGMGERRMLLVSSGTFSGMKELSSAASGERTRTLNYTHTDRERDREREKHTRLKWQYIFLPIMLIFSGLNLE